MPFLNLTPGTRSGIIQDERYAAFIDALNPLEAHVQGLIEEQQRAEEEQASQQSLKAIQKAFHEAMLALPREEYDWFDVQGARPPGGIDANAVRGGLPAGTDWEEVLPGVAEDETERVAAATILRLRRSPIQCRRLAGREHHTPQ